MKNLMYAISIAMIFSSCATGNTGGPLNTLNEKNLLQAQQEQCSLVGYTKDDIQEKFGNPSERMTSVNAYSTYEIWTYYVHVFKGFYNQSNTIMVTFQDGRVLSVTYPPSFNY